MANFGSAAIIEFQVQRFAFCSGCGLVGSEEVVERLYASMRLLALGDVRAGAGGSSFTVRVGYA